MVTGFEEITSELTPFEQTVILPIVIRGWESRDPKEKELVLMSDMIKKLNEYCKKHTIHPYRTLKSGQVKSSNKPYIATGPRMRKIIHHIRVRGIVPDLIATSKGYFRTDDKKEIANFIKSCRERANSFNEVARAMEVYNFER